MERLGLSLPMNSVFVAADLSAGHGPGDLLNNIGLCVIVAAILAFLANKLKQPALLAYLLAGVLIGPEIGFRLGCRFRFYSEHARFGRGSADH